MASNDVFCFSQRYMARMISRGLRDVSDSRPLIPLLRHSPHKSSQLKMTTAPHAAELILNFTTAVRTVTGWSVDRSLGHSPPSFQGQFR